MKERNKRNLHKFKKALSVPPTRSEGQKVFLTKGGGSNYGKFNNGSNKFRQQAQTSQQSYGKCTFFKQNLLQHELSSRTKLKMAIRKCSPIDKKVVLHKQSSKRSNSGKTKTFLKGLEKINQGSEYPEFNRWLFNSLSKETFSKTPFQLATSREQQKLIDKEVKEMLKKGAIRQASTVKGEFLSNLLLVKKKNEGGKCQ